MERWRARLAVAGDPGGQADGEEGAAGAEEGEEEEAGGGGGDSADVAHAGGEYQFVAEGERRSRGVQRASFSCIARNHSVLDVTPLRAGANSRGFLDTLQRLSARYPA